MTSTATGINSLSESRIALIQFSNSAGGVFLTTAALLGLFLLSACYAVLVQQHYFIDGSHFFLELLRTKSFIYEADFPRHHAHYLTQALTVLLLKAGVKDLDILSCSFGFGLYLPLIGSVVVCYFITKSSEPRFVFFPLLSLFGVAANHSFMMIHESHVPAALFWPLFFYILIKDKFDLKNAFFAIVLSLLFIRTYESVAILGAILLVALAVRMHEAWQKSTGLTQAVWLLQSLIFLVGIAIALYFSLFPGIPENRASFAASFGWILSHWPALMSLCYIGVVSLLILIPHLPMPMIYPATITILSVFSLFVGLSPLLVPELMRPGLQHAARSYLVTMAPVVAFLAFLVMRNHLVVPAKTWNRFALLLILLAISQTTWQFLASSQWNGFSRVFREELKTHRGPTPFEETALIKERVGIQLIRPMTWGWTQPTLSILWAPDKNVRAIILNPASESGRWQPFDPTNADKLPEIEWLGFSYDAYRNSLRK